MEKLYNKAQELADRFEYELAIKFCKKALEIDNKNFECLHMLSSLFIELGDLELSIQTYQQLIHLYPDDHMAYIALAELLSSIEYYEKGLQIFLLHKNPDNLTLCNIYCSLAELYLIAEEKEKLEQATHYLELAERYRHDDPQISYLKAQLATSQDRPKEEIIHYLDHCLALLSDSSNQSDSSYDMRFEISKLLFSFENDDNAVESAIRTLYDLLAEQDDDPDVCFLLGKALIENSSTDTEDAQDGKSLLFKAKTLYQQLDNSYYREQITIIDEMLSSC